MEPVLVILVIPALACGLLRADSIRRQGMDQQGRETARLLLQILTVPLLCLSLLFVWLMLQAALDAAHDATAAVLMVLRLGVAGGLVALAWVNWKVAGQREEPELSLREIAQRDHEATQLRTIALLFVLLPLALPAMLAIVTVGFIPLIVFGFSSQPQAIIRNRLLWTLALASQGGREFPEEVHQLAASLEKERYSVSRLIAIILTSIAFLLTGGCLIAHFPILFVPAFAIGSLIGLTVGLRKRGHNLMIRRVQQLATSLFDGIPLGEALQQDRMLVDPALCGAIQVADSPRQLKEVLKRLAVEHTRQLERRFLVGQSSETSLMYAFIVLTMLLQVIGFIMYWIIPKYKAIFYDFGVELPQLTQFWIEVSDWFVSYWYLAGPFLCLPLLPSLFASILSLEESKWIPSFVLRMFPRIESPKLLRLLGYTATYQQRLQPALRALAHSTTDFIRSQRIERLETGLDLGESLGTVLREEGYINTREAYSLDNAAQLGHLSWALQSIANTIQHRREYRVRWLNELLRPAVVILLGILVASFCLGMFYPLIQLIVELA